MPILAATNLKHAYGENIVLDGVSLSIEPDERIGVVGRNGAGKSTLLKMLAGIMTPDSGDVSLRKGCKVGYLHQDPVLDPDDTLKGAAEAGFAELHELHRELEALFERMSGAEGETLERLLRQQSELEKRVEAAGGYAVEHRVEQVLHGLGFTSAQFGVKVRGLSGGQRARVALARLLLDEPEVLLLDEPTNHLDIDGRLWLERFLRDEYKGAVVMISHDRYLLDAVVNRIIETEFARLVDYPGNYAKFRELRAERRVTQLRAYEKQQEKFKKEEAYIRKFKAGQRAKQAKGRETRLEREKATERLERPMELKELSIALPKAERTGDVVVSAREIAKRYPREDGSTLTLFDKLDVKIGRGERWAILGPNGAGKTTLVRALLGEIPVDEGTVRLGSNVQPGHFKQTRDDLDPETPLYRHIQNTILKENPAARLSEQQARDLAGAFLFSGSEQERPMGVLSGGERARVAMAALLASSKNLLVLDEPTNHLDIPAAERLEQALAPHERGGVFDGTLILISHDRALIDATCDHLLVFDGRGGVRVFLGNYSEWRAKELARDAAPGTTPAPARPTKASSTPAPQAPGVGTAVAKPPPAKRKSRFSWMKLDQIEERLHELETDVAELDERLAAPATWTDPALSQRLTEARSKLAAELEELEAEWIERAEE